MLIDLINYWKKITILIRNGGYVMKWSIYYLSIVACLLCVMLAGASQSEAKTSVVNLMIIADMPLSATEDQEAIAESYLFDMYNVINERNLTATIFSTQDLIDSHARLRLTDIGISSDFELAMSGNNSDEKLSSESLERQKEILETSKKYVEGCRICGRNEIIAKGFMPLSFDQNENTYKVLDELGIEYDAGFQAGILFAPGHEEDVWTYKVANHNFYAVPVSTYELSGKKVPLVDSYAKDEGISSSQWYDLMKAKFDDAQGKKEPVVISLSTSISGTGDYLEALKQFLDYAMSKDARFLTTIDLVNMSRQEDFEETATSIAKAKSETGISSNATITEEGSSGCASCDSKKKASMNATAQNETISIIMNVGENKSE